MIPSSKASCESVCARVLHPSWCMSGVSIPLVYCHIKGGHKQRSFRFSIMSVVWRWDSEQRASADLSTGDEMLLTLAEVHIWAGSVSRCHIFSFITKDLLHQVSHINTQSKAWKQHKDTLEQHKLKSADFTVKTQKEIIIFLSIRPAWR